jgi:hypothetical protein
MNRSILRLALLFVVVGILVLANGGIAPATAEYWPLSMADAEKSLR